MLLGNVIASLIRALWPNAPYFLPQFVGSLIPLVIDLVKELMNEDLAGEEKFKEALETTKVILDDSFDTLPEWRDLSEEKRDTIIAGLIELAYFVVKVAGKPEGKRKLRKVARTLKGRL